MSLPDPPGNDDAMAASRRLVEALDNPFAFGHPLQQLQIIETHISWVILTGRWAYKIKKPVQFGFLDFANLEQRHYYCQEELRLNRRFAPDIYLELVAVRGSPTQPRLHGGGEILEYAVKMRQFSQQDLLSSYAEEQRLDAEQIDAIAETVARIHEHCDRSGPDDDWGSLTSITHWSAENLSNLRTSIPGHCLPPSWSRLQDWYRQTDSLSTGIVERKQDGFVRECHGDLHLGNMAMIGGRITLFDCIEFNPELRWIDVVSEAAFVAMDLQARGFSGYCWRFLDRYFVASGDYAGIDLLRYYFVYRALVRAKVAALRAAAPGQAAASDCQSFDQARHYIELADAWTRAERPGMILMHGLSGSGKSTVAAQLVESLGAFRLRSDVERKRLHGLGAQDNSDSAIEGGIYGPEASEKTYRRLAEIADGILAAGHRVIVDAAFLHRDERRRLLDCAAARGVPCTILPCHAPRQELERRLENRRGDASEADVAVLRHQLHNHDPIDDTELGSARLIKLGATELSAHDIEQIETSLFDSIPPVPVT